MTLGTSQRLGTVNDILSDVSGWDPRFTDESEIPVYISTNSRGLRDWLPGAFFWLKIRSSTELCACCVVWFLLTCDKLLTTLTYDIWWPGINTTV